MDIKTADDALKMYRWAARKWHEELDAAAAISASYTAPSEWRLRSRQKESSAAAFAYASKFSKLKARYWSTYEALGGRLTRDAVDQEAGLAHRIQQGAK